MRQDDAAPSASSPTPQSLTEAYIRSNYGKESNEDIANHLGIGKIEVQALARQFGLRVKLGAGLAYSPEDDAFLRANLGKMTLVEIGKHLGRSPDSLGSRLSVLGLRRKNNSYSNLGRAARDVEDKQAYCKRRRALCQIFERHAGAGTPEQSLALAVILQAVKDIGTSHDDLVEVLDGSLDEWYQHIGIEPEAALAWIRQADLITNHHMEVMRKRYMQT